jgi:hypothetical protein
MLRNPIKQFRKNPSELANTAVSADFDVAAAKTDGIRKIALQQCMTQEGEAQRLCKKQADADYDVAIKHAKAAQANAHTPSRPIKSHAKSATYRILHRLFLT